MFFAEAQQVIRTFAALLLLLVLAVSKSATPRYRVLTIHSGFVKARTFLEWDEAARRAYSMGFIDGLYMAPFLGAPENNNGLVSLAACLEGMKASQVAAVIEKHVRENPEHWHWDLKNEAYAAMRQACPISAEPNKNAH
jgi:hypothetical protein